MYYVYVHIRLDNNEIFYVGKGRNNRAFSTLSRNKYWHNVVNKYGYRVEILESNLSEFEAFEKEKDLIKSINPTTNLTSGGEGGDTYSKMPDSDKEMFRINAQKRAGELNSGIVKAAQKRKGQTKDTCDALRIMADKNSKAFSGEGNPMYGKTHWTNKNQKQKDVIKKKISKALKVRYKANPRIYDKITCPHCGKVGGKPGLTRYHFNNCKLK